MNLIIVTPAPRGSTTGNRITARRWASLLRSLGHSVVVRQRLDPNTSISRFDVMLALHARRSCESIALWRENFKNRPLVCCLTGTDLHVDLQKAPDSIECQQARQSLKLADRIVLLEPNGLNRLGPEILDKSVVIYQSARRLRHPPEKSREHFTLAIAAHLRQIKDPFLTESASRLLPSQSRIQVIHVGEALEPESEERACQLAEENSRYRWLGGVRHARSVRILASSYLTVVSSRLEGAPSVISEAAVHEVPVLATRIDATLGLLGPEYPGFFEVGQANQLAELMWRAESDTRWYSQLKDHMKTLSARFDPDTERASLADLLQSLR